VAAATERREARGHPDQGIVVGPTRLDEGHLHVLVLAQAVGQDAASLKRLVRTQPADPAPTMM
jgi:hypothetical protein